MTTARSMIESVRSWVELRDDILALSLVGSHARGTAAPDSDIDLTLVCSDPIRYLTNTQWLSTFGEVTSTTREDYGKVQSLRVLYRDGTEVEFGIAGLDWTEVPPDSETAQVLRTGCVILHDRAGLLARLLQSALELRPDGRGTQPVATDREKIIDYYAGFDEWERLASPEGALEMERSLRILDAYLRPDSRVLDLGGGPGRYAIELARRGHRVVLADLAPALLAQARARIAASDVQERIESIDEVDAQDLGRYARASFDAVLAFGPFYHLVSHDERLRAAREIARVLAAGGLAFAAFVPRISGVAGLIERAANRPGQVAPETLRIAAQTGVFRNQSSLGFQEGYYPLPGEIEALLGAAGLQVLQSVSLRSIAHRIEKQLGALEPAMRAAAEELIAALGRQPEVVATSGHVLVIARRPAEPAE
jgi:SAM-dependent methyltransferase/predicted nucleotidyltransferase